MYTETFLRGVFFLIPFFWLPPALNLLGCNHYGSFGESDTLLTSGALCLEGMGCRCSDRDYKQSRVMCCGHDLTANLELGGRSRGLDHDICMALDEVKLF